MTLLYKELQSYDHIIFDWNGTLLSDVNLTWSILTESLEQHDLKPITLETFRDLFSFPIKDFYRNIGVVRDDHLQTFHDYFHKAYNERYSVDAHLFSGTMELIDALKNEGKHLSVLSAAEQNHLHEAVGHFGVMPHMNHVYGVENRSAEGKAERGHHLISQVPHHKERTIIVGDTLYDADVAKALKIDVLLIADGHQSYKQLERSGCKILPSRYA
jgi:phosphoglycolate phosphatase